MDLHLLASHFLAIPGHYRVANKRDLPPPRDDDRLYVYVMVLEKRAKIGVTAHIANRARAHERVAGNMTAAYFLDLPRAEAFQREAILCRSFGKWGSRGKPGEWFDLEHVPLAVYALREPTVLDIRRTIELELETFARNGSDCHFALVETPWASAVGARAA